MLGYLLAGSILASSGTPVCCELALEAPGAPVLDLPWRVSPQAAPRLLLAGSPAAVAQPAALPEPRTAPSDAPPAPDITPAGRVAPPAVHPGYNTSMRWYGGPIIAIDALSILALINFGGRNDVVLRGCVAAFLVGGPIVHLAHGNFGKSLLSVTLRAGLPLASAYVLATIDASSANPDSDMKGVAGLVIGLVLGVAGAVAIDNAALARESVEVPIADRTEPASADSVSVAPVVAPTRAGGLVGLAVAF